MQRFVVIDLETTGHAAHKDDRIIEIGIVIVENLEIKQTFSTFVNPEREIPSFIQSLTTISNDDVKDAPLFKDVALKVQSFFEESYFVAHNVHFDLNFLNEQLKMFNVQTIESPTIDTVELARILFPTASSYKLSDITKYLNISHKQPHRALSDALVTAKLLIKLIKKLKNLPKETIVYLKKLAPFLQSNIDRLLKDIEGKNIDDLDNMTVHKDLSFKQIKFQKNKISFYNEDYKTFLNSLYRADGLLKEKYPNYENRIGQQDISETIFESFENNNHALIEATTGSGKTLSYLIPAIYKAVKENTRVVISTYTTQLQNQILHNELEQMKDLLPFSFEASILKGKRNYLSLGNFYNTLQEDYSCDNYDVVLAKAMILVWITESNTGDLSEIQLPNGVNDFYYKICERSLPTNENKSWLQYSYFQNAKELSKSSHLIIVNHALLCQDLLTDHDLIPPYSFLIIDEAHHLERVASYEFGQRMSYAEIQNILNRLGTSEEKSNIQLVSELLEDKNIVKEWNHIFKDFKYEIDLLYHFIFKHINKRKKESKINDVGKMIYQITDDDLIDSNWQSIRDIASRAKLYLSRLLSLLAKYLQSIKLMKIDLTTTIHILLEELQKIDVSLKLLLEQNKDDYSTTWFEIDTNGSYHSLRFFNQPYKLSNDFQTNLFEKKNSVVLIGAGLTVNNSFSFLKENLGINLHNIIEKNVPSPFSYEDKVKLLIPNDFPSVKDDSIDDYTIALAEAILSIAEVVHGRILVLFTSFEMLNQTYYYLKEFLENDYVLFAQGISTSSRERLIKNFQSFEDSILLGTNSFWEGVDFRINNLKAVVIARLPFEPLHDPLYTAREKQLKYSNKNPFTKYALPKAVIRFKQGFGRLIRKETDRGIVFVSDDRIMKKNYGEVFINSLPKGIDIHYDSIHTLINEIEDWI